MRTLGAQIRSHWRSESSLAVGGVSAGVAAVVQCAVGLVAAAITARSLGPEGKGAYDLCFATASIVTLIVQFSLPSGIVYTLAAGKSDSSPLARSLKFMIVAQAGGGLLLLALFAISPWRRFVLASGSAVETVSVVSLLVLALLAVGTYRAMLIGQKRFLVASAIDILKQLLWVVGLAWCWIVTRDQGANLGYHLFIVVTALASLVSGFLSMRSVLPSRPDGKSGIKAVLAYSAPCYFGNLVQATNIRLDAFVVNGFCGIGALGIYQLAVTLSQSVSVIPGTIASLLVPTVASRGDAQEEMVSFTVRIARIAAGCVGIVSIALAGVAYFAVPCIFGSEFEGATVILCVVLLARVVGVYTGVFAGYLAGIGKPSLNLSVAASSAIVNVLAQLLLVPRLELVGAALGSLISACWSAGLTSYFMLRGSGMSAANLVPSRNEDFAAILIFARTMFRRIFPV